MRRGSTGARVVRGIAGVALALVLPGHPAAQTPSTLDLLDLYYSPSGVERSGFHTISVSVHRPGAVVEARRGYFGG